MLKQSIVVLSLLATASLAQVQKAQACFSPVATHQYFEVRLASQEIKMLTGDMISLSWSDAVIPDSMGLRVVLNYDKDLVRLVNEESIFADETMPPAGSFGKRYYFKALKEGSSTIEIKVIGRDGKVRSDVKQQIDVSKKPVYRGATDLAKCG